MELAAVGQDVLGERDAHGAADVAGDVDQRRGLIGLVLADALVGGRGDRQEHHRQADADVDPRPREERERRGAVDPRQVVHAERHDGHAGGDQPFRLEERRGAPGEEHHHHGDDAARAEDEARQGGGVAVIFLGDLRDELRRRDEDRPGEHHHHEAGSELPVADEPQVDGRVLRVQEPRNHGDERDHHEDAGDVHQRRGAEPVLPLPLVEDRPPASRGTGRPAGSRRGRTGCPCAPGRARSFLAASLSSISQYIRPSAMMPTGPVDQEAPVPGCVVGQPAAERRPDHGRDHDGDAVEREGLPRFSGGKESARIDWASGAMPPPPSPCSTRKKSSDSRLQAKPHRIDATVNRRHRPHEEAPCGRSAWPGSSRPSA